MAFASLSGRMLIAGEPMYVWSANPAAPGLDTTAAYLGVVLEGDAVTPLPRPSVPGIVTHVRLLADGPDVAAIFAAQDSSAVGVRGARLSGYWFGRTDGRTWHSLERLPLPGKPLDAVQASALVRGRDGLVIAVPYGDQVQTHVAIYARSAAGWRMDTLTPSHAPYLALSTHARGLSLYVVYGDSVERPDMNSLWVYHDTGTGWRLGGRVVRGGVRPVYRPTVIDRHDGTIVTWLEVRADGAVVRAARVRQDGSLDTVMTIAPGVENFRAWSRGGVPRWMAASPGNAGSGTLTLVEWSTGVPVVRDVVHTPFTGPALAFGDSTAVALGPVFDPTSVTTPLVSGLLRFAPRCSAPVPRVAP